MDNTIQQLLDYTEGRFVELPPGEYEGPFVVKRPLNIMGNATTLWAKKGPVLTIKSSEVAMRDLRVEATGGTDEPCILSNTGDTRFENIEISGTVKGVPKEEGIFDIPNTITLGEFYGNRECSFQMEIVTPVKLRIRSLIKDVAIAPEEIEAGKAVITIKTGKMRPETYLYGDILFQSAFVRRVYVNGAAKENPEGYEENSLLYQTTAAIAESSKGAGPISYGSVTPVTIDPDAVFLQKGQRLPWNMPDTEIITLGLYCENMPQGMEIDPYVFLLDRNQKAVEDWRLVFFGNPVSRDHGVKILEENAFSGVSIQLSTVRQDIERISVAYAIYEDSPGGIFSCVKEPVIKVRCGGKDIYAYEATGLTEETTIIGVEFYRYKEAWKLTAIGAGYKDGIRRLCESYGLDIIG